MFVPRAESPARLISLLAHQWEALCGQERPVWLTAEARPGGSWSLCPQCLAQCPPGAGKPLLFSKCFLFQYPLLIVLPENVNTSIQLAVSNLGGEGAAPADLWPTPLLLCGRLHQCPVFCRGSAVNVCALGLRYSFMGPLPRCQV